MTDVLFYHLQNMKVDNVLPPLIEKSIERGWRVAVQSTSEVRVQQLDMHLWTFREDAFLPHASFRSPRAASQPVLLTVEEANANQASVRFLVDQASIPADAVSYDRLVLVFDGDDEAQVQSARAAWVQCRSLDVKATYWQADENGRWKQRA